MTKEEFALLSDAIKIGFPIVGTVFGAVIGGIAAYFVSRQSHKNERLKWAEQRRHELLISACQGVANFEHAIATYTTSIANHVQNLPGVIDMAQAREAVLTQNITLRLARANLKVLGLKEAEQHLEEYLDATREVVRKGPNLSAERAVALVKLIAPGPTKFYESLSSSAFPAP